MYHYFTNIMTAIDYFLRNHTYKWLWGKKKDQPIRKHREKEKSKREREKKGEKKVKFKTGKVSWKMEEKHEAKEEGNVKEKRKKPNET